MIVRIGRSKRLITCSSIRTQEWDDGLDIELFDVNGKEGKRKLIELPQDTSMVSVLDECGKVTKKYTYSEDR